LINKYYPCPSELFIISYVLAIILQPDLLPPEYKELLF